MPEIESSTPLDAIQFEIKRLLILDERAKAIKQLRTGIIFAAAGAEMVNRQLGQPLELTGFARTTAVAVGTEKKYDPVLHELYMKYWRRPMRSVGSGGGDDGGNAILDLGMALAMSAVSFHVSQMDLGSILMPK